MHSCKSLLQKLYSLVAKKICDVQNMYFVSLPCSSAWAAGAIAYEFFGNVNPFGWDGLDSRNYKDDDLPVLVQ